MDRRAFLRATTLAATAALPSGEGRGQQTAAPGETTAADRVLVVNEASNTVAVIDPRRNAVESTINLTSFDEDPRPAYRYVTAGVPPTAAEMIDKPLYHGCIGAHGAAASADQTLVALTGRGSSNLYLIDTVHPRVLGNRPNPFGSATTNAECISSGVLVGRDPGAPAFTRNGREVWVPLRGEDRIAIVDTGRALKEVAGTPSGAVRALLQTVHGPSHVIFSGDGTLAYIVSEKVARVDVIRVNADTNGYARPQRAAMLDISQLDSTGCTSFEQLTPDGTQLWLAHALGDSLSVLSAHMPFAPVGRITLGEMARPHAVAFVENARGRAAYVSYGRVSASADGGAASEIAIVERGASAEDRKVAKTFPSGGRKARGLCVNPANTLLYVAHEQDEAAGNPYAGQSVCSAFDVSDPYSPRMIAQIPLGALLLPSGELPNTKSTSIAYVRPRSGIRLGWAGAG